MFCPNCGNDAGASNFCSHCGCDLCSSNGEALNVPVGKYQGTLGYLVLDENALTIHKKILFKTVERKISYDRVAKVAFEKATGMGMGFLCIRSADDRNIPLSKNGTASSDETSLVFGSQANEMLLPVVEFLGKLAVCNERCFTEPSVKLMATVLWAEEAPQAEDTESVQLSEEIDLEPYFRAYAPGRLPAIKALMHDTGMDMRQAKDLIDSYFNARQQEIYSSDPLAAIRDLKRAINPTKAAFQERKVELDAAGQVYCPKCLSTSVSANQKGFGFVNGALAANIGLDAGMIVGGIGSKKIICTCLKCGYQWKPGKK